jgi:hypothetical protein
LTKWLLDFLQLKYSEKKSVWKPTTELEFLGLILNSEIREFKVPHGKLSLFQKFVGKLLSKARQVSAHDTESVEVSLNDIQKILGSFQCLSLALEPAKILSRSLQHLTKGVTGKYTRVRLSESAISELRFWHSEECWGWNGKFFRSRLDLDLEFPPISLNVDASDEGWGGVLHHQDGDICVFGGFSDNEKLLSSTERERELLALLFCIQDPTLLQALAGRRVLVCMDNTGAVRNIVNGGGAHTNLSHIMKEIWVWFSINDITAVPQWVPREVNGFADALSRYQNYEELLLSLDSASWLFKKFGQPEVDRFASRASQCCQFGIPGSLSKVQQERTHVKALRVLGVYQTEFCTSPPAGHPKTSRVP